VNWIIQLLRQVAEDVVVTLVTTWPFLLISILAAAALTTYAGTERLGEWMRGRVWVSVVGAVALASLTPFCSCATSAVVIAGMATSTPWAPLVTFMVASPLTSPAELLLSAGLMGWPFALTFFAGTIGIGLAAGGLTAILERAGWLRNQARMQSSSASGEASCETPPIHFSGDTLIRTGIAERLRLADFARNIKTTTRRLLSLLLLFTTAGYLVIRAIPTDWITDLLGEGSSAALPLAALVGIPTYVNTEASLPLVAALVDGGMGTGAALAYLVTGAGASLGSISAMLIIARRRVVGLVIAILLAGGIALGLIGEMFL